VVEQIKGTRCDIKADRNEHQIPFSLQVTNFTAEVSPLTAVSMATANLTMGLCRNGIAGYLAEAHRPNKASVVLSDCTSVHSAYLVLRTSLGLNLPFLPAKLSQAAALLACIREGSRSKLGQETNYSLSFMVLLSISRTIPGMCIKIGHVDFLSYSF
jgi:hypothetical protein